MFIVPVDLSQVETKLRTNLFSEILAQVFYLRRVSECCVGANCDLFLFLYHMLLLEKCWVHNWIWSLFGHTDWTIHLVYFWFWCWIRRYLVVDEHVQSLCSVGSPHILFRESHWNLRQKEEQINECPCSLLKNQCRVRINMVCCWLD